MIVAIRADGGAAIGSGHVARCLALASELRSRGAQVSLVSRALTGGLLARAQAGGVQTLPLPELKTSAEAFDEIDDAAQTALALAGIRPDWLIVDHYGLGALWASALRPHVDAIFVIDDLGDRSLDCDLVLNQNYAGHTLAPEGCRRMMGPQFALLGPEYCRVRDEMGERSNEVHRVLVSFGGSDPTNETVKALEAVSVPALAHLDVDVVLGHDHSDSATVRSMAAARGKVTVHANQPTLAPLMVKADLALGACGSTTWERACLGLPSIVTVVVPNQRVSAFALAAEGCQFLVDDSGAAGTYPDWDRALAGVMASPALRLAASRLSRQLTDGHGAARVAQAIYGQQDLDLTLPPLGAVDHRKESLR